MIRYTTSYTMQPADQIMIGVNGDLLTDPQTWLDSFVFAADEAPAINGTVSVTCAPAPDPALAGIAPVLTSHARARRCHDAAWLWGH